MSYFKCSKNTQYSSWRTPFFFRFWFDSNNTNKDLNRWSPFYRRITTPRLSCECCHTPYKLWLWIFLPVCDIKVLNIVLDLLRKHPRITQLQQSFRQIFLNFKRLDLLVPLFPSLLIREHWSRERSHWSSFFTFHADSDKRPWFIFSRAQTRFCIFYDPAVKFGGRWSNRTETGLRELHAHVCVCARGSEESRLELEALPEAPRIIGEVADFTVWR